MAWTPIVDPIPVMWESSGPQHLRMWQIEGEHGVRNSRVLGFRLNKEFPEEELPP